MQATDKIILGTVQFGLEYGINNNSGQPTQLQANEMLSVAYNAGIRVLDTAEAYGNAHFVIGEFHKNYPDQLFQVITKLPHYINEDIEVKIEKYLNELYISELNGLLFHSYKTYKENKASIALLNDYKRSGKVKNIGVSIYTNYEMEDVIKDENIDVIQLPFNLFDNINLRGGVLKEAKARGKIIHTRSAFLQGLFFAPLEKESKAIRNLTKELKYIHTISKDYQISIQNMALNYCLQQPNIDNVLIGVDNLIHLNQNLIDSKNDIPVELVEKINQIHIKEMELLNPSLWN